MHMFAYLTFIPLKHHFSYYNKIIFNCFEKLFQDIVSHLKAFKTHSSLFAHALLKIKRCKNKNKIKIYSINGTSIVIIIIHTYKNQKDKAISQNKHVLNQSIKIVQLVF